MNSPHPLPCVEDDGEVLAPGGDGSRSHLDNTRYVTLDVRVLIHYSGQHVVTRLEKKTRFVCDYDKKYKLLRVLLCK